MSRLVTWTGERCGRPLAALCTIGCLAAPAALGQVPVTPWPQPMPQQEPQRPALLPDPMDILLRNAQPGNARPFGAPPQGLPVLFPPDWGAYPGGLFPMPFRAEGSVTPIAPAEPRSPNHWPRWLPGHEGEGFTPDLAILAQTTDYVWVREPEEPVFVPLAYWDRFRVVKAGTAIEVRSGGQFLMRFHRGASLRVAGRTKLDLLTLDEEGAEIAFTDLAHVVATASERPLRMRIGSAGTVEVLSSRVSLHRERGMVHVENLGPGALVLRARDQETPVPAGTKAILLPELPAEAPPGELQLEGDLATSRDGRVLRAEAGSRDGSLSWSGARFRLPAGAVLRLDPLAGSEFPERFPNSR